MASKILFFHMFLALAMLAVQLEGGGALPELHFTNAVNGRNPAPINLQIKAGGILRGSAQLKAGQDYEMRVKVDDVYSVAAVFGTRFTAFHAYESARDKSHAAVYWKADNDGFSISYDQTTWNMVAPWESE